MSRTRRHLSLMVLLGALLAVLSACTQATVPDPPPATPTGLTATPGDAQVMLSWNPNSEPDLARYHLYRGTDPGDLSLLETVPAGTETFTDSGLANGTTYHYAISAEDANGQMSARSATVSATPTDGSGDTPTPPTVLETDPANGASNVAVNDDITITFSAAMDRASVEAAWTSEPEVTCRFTWNFTATSVTCQPQSALAANTTYRVRLGISARSAQGEALAAPYEFSFTTTDASLPVCVFGDETQGFGACVFGP